MAENTHVCQTESMRVLGRLKLKPCNKVCFDCDTRNPTWASATFGVFLCLTCSGRHRSLGTHISFVRSVDMDKWRHDHLEAMKLSGNDKAAKFFASHGWKDKKRDDFESKYTSRAAQLYKKQLYSKINPEDTKKDENDVERSSETDNKSASTTTLEDLVEHVSRTTIEPKVAPIKPQIKVKKSSPVGETKLKPRLTTAKPVKADKRFSSLTRKRPVRARSNKGKLSTQLSSNSVKDLSNAKSLYQKSSLSSNQQRAKTLNFEKSGDFSRSSGSEEVDSMQGNAVDRFSSSKGISSDMYFNRDGRTQAERDVEAARLSKFSNARSISSDAYFGRTSTFDEDDMPLDKFTEDVVNGFMKSVQQ